MSSQITELLSTVETNIKSLESTSGLKKKMQIYNETQKSIKKCKELINNIKIDPIKKSDESCKDDEEYDTLLNEITETKNKITEDMDLEELIKLSTTTMLKISKCENYVKTKTVDIVEL